jgi:hypothetical protein
MNLQIFCKILKRKDFDAIYSCNYLFFRAPQPLSIVSTGAAWAQPAQISASGANPQSRGIG